MSTILQKACRYFARDYDLNRPPRDTSDIADSFKILAEAALAKDVNALYITEYLQSNIASEARRNRKVTARDFEDFLEVFLDGRVTDKKGRETDRGIMESFDDELVGEYAARNRREKGDVDFGNFMVSVKTLVPSNPEVNWGSFAREALFHGIIEEYGGERKSGLGSVRQMKGLFQKVKEEGKWDLLVDRFTEMVDAVFVDDIIFAIKGGTYLEIFIVSNDDFREVMTNAFKNGPDSAAEIAINRYEGNSIRSKLSPFQNDRFRVRFAFGFYDFSIVVQLRKLTQSLEDVVVDQINGQISRDQALDKIEEVNELLRDLLSPE